MYDCRRIHRYAIAQSGFETHLVRGRHGGLIQPMTQAPHHAVYVQLPAGGETDFQLTSPSSLSWRASTV